MNKKVKCLLVNIWLVFFVIFLISGVILRNLHRSAEELYSYSWATYSELTWFGIVGVSFLLFILTLALRIIYLILEMAPKMYKKLKSK